MYEQHTKKIDIPVLAPSRGEEQTRWLTGVVKRRAARAAATVCIKTLTVVRVVRIVIVIFGGSTLRLDAVDGFWEINVGRGRRHRIRAGCVLMYRERWYR